jgi:hypothetical protein
VVTGARTPEELEMLLEDAFVLRDHEALAQLFEAGAVLVAGGGLAEARGEEEIVRAATQMWDRARMYLPDPQRVLQVRDTALVLGGHAVNVVHRGHDGSWRYAVSFLDVYESKENGHGVWTNRLLSRRDGGSVPGSHR